LTKIKNIWFKQVKERKKACSLIFLLVLLVSFSSCNVTKRVATDEYLLDKVVVEVDNPEVDREALLPYMKLRTNKKIFGARFHLWVYNLANPKKENRWHNWLREIGEEPFMYDEALKDRTNDQFLQYLRNSGYFDAEVSNSVNLKNKKADVEYVITTNSPYIIQNVNYQIIDTSITDVIYNDTVNSLVKTGQIFDLSVMDAERKRLEQLMKELGYFGFNRNFVYFEADSNLEGNNVGLDFVINHNSLTQTEPIIPHDKYVFNKVFIHTEYKRRQIFEDPASYYSEIDTIERSKDLYLLYHNYINIKPNNVLQFNYIDPGNQFRQSDVDKSYRVFNSLPIVRLTNIQFSPLNEFDSLGRKKLDCNIFLSPQKRQSYSLDAELTLQGSDWGGGGSFSYNNRNLLKGAESFKIRFYGEIESVAERLDSIDQKYISDYGVEAKIIFPKFILPFNTTGYEKRFNPTTQLTLAANNKDLAFLKSSIVNLSWAYSWRGNRYLRHILKPLDIYYVNADVITEEGQAIIDLYPDQSAFTTHLVSAMSYSFIYSNQSNKPLKDFIYFRHNIETAGSLVSALNLLRGDTLGNKKLFGQKYSQYIKSDFDFRFYHVINEANTMVYRLFAGVGYPFGNSQSMPNEKQYFNGGENSIRAWRQYDLHPDSSAFRTTNYYKGDVKLEANVEYRFDLVWLLEGALFADAGNVWNLKSLDFEDESFSNFKFNRFYTQLALAGGFGLRLDLNYFILRLDLGIRLIDPLLPAGRRWALSYPYTGIDKKFRHITKLNFGIGYPF
jgi:hypothetical protein